VRVASEGPAGAVGEPVGDPVGRSRREPGEALSVRGAGLVEGLLLDEDELREPERRPGAEAPLAREGVLGELELELELDREPERDPEREPDRDPDREPERDPDREPLRVPERPERPAREPLRPPFRAWPRAERSVACSAGSDPAERAADVALAASASLARAPGVPSSARARSVDSMEPPSGLCDAGRVRLFDGGGFTMNVTSGRRAPRRRLGRCTLREEGRVRWWVPLVAVGCGGPGQLHFPGGSAPIRTAWYRIDSQPNPQLQVFLSTGRFPCSFPDVTGEAYREALGELQVAACREDSRHVGLSLFQVRGTDFDGVYPAEAGANAAALGPGARRLANGSYFAVEEAFLVEVQGLGRAYSPSEETYLPELGSGQVEVDSGDRLRGALSFDAGVHGHFVAEACPAEDGLLDLLVSAPLQLCP